MSEPKTEPNWRPPQKELEALLNSPGHEVDSLERILSQLPDADRKEAMRILYGDLPETIAIPKVQNIADAKDLDRRLSLWLPKSSAASEWFNRCHPDQIIGHICPR